MRGRFASKKTGRASPNRNGVFGLAGRRTRLEPPGAHLTAGLNQFAGSRKKGHPARFDPVRAGDGKGMDTRRDDVLGFERLPYRAHRRLAWAAVEWDAGRPPTGPRVGLAIALAIIANRVREARAAQVGPEPSGPAGPFAARTRARPMFAARPYVIVE
jgi:hypothetical protein